MGDNPLLENVEHVHQENAEEPLIPQDQQNDVAPEEGQVAGPRPRLLNVREVILPPLPPVNGIIQIPNGPATHQELLLSLEEHLGRYANLADLLARQNEPVIHMGEIRELLDAIDLVEEEERAEDNEERRNTPDNEAPPEEKHDEDEIDDIDDIDDSDGSDSSDGDELFMPSMADLSQIAKI